jgi:hypothetical protein
MDGPALQSRHSAYRSQGVDESSPPVFRLVAFLFAAYFEQPPLSFLSLPFVVASIYNDNLLS